MKNIYLILGTVLLMIAVFLAGDRHGHLAMQVKIDKANQKYQKLKDKQQEKINELTTDYIARIDDVSKQRDAALDKLRSRSDRMPTASLAKCKGATGKQLSRRDAEFLTRLAGRADRLREALRVCYAYEETVRKKHE